MKKLTDLLIILTVSAVLIGCSDSSLNSSNGGDSDDTGTNQSSSTSIDSVGYFYGGWFPAPGLPSFSYDAKISFDSLSVSLKDPNGGCDYQISLTQEEADNILALINEMEVEEILENPVRADGGTEYIEIFKRDGSSYKAYIDHLEAPPGELRITNNAVEISEYLIAIFGDPGRRVRNCSTSIDLNFDRIEYFYGGWYGIEGQPNWEHDYSINFSNRTLSGYSLEYGECMKQRTLSLDEISYLSNLIHSMGVREKSSTEPIMADGAYDRLTLIDSSTNKRTEIYFSIGMAAPGEYVSSDTELSNVLKDWADIQSYFFLYSCSFL